jgi:predicted dehydrogenase
MIRIGVIGHGHRISGFIKHNLRKVDPEVRVVGIVDPNEEKARSFLDECDKKDVVFYKDLDTMAREGKIDCLAIGTRCNLHTPYAIEAAKYDIPLFLEKPVAVSIEQCMALENAYENHKGEVVVSFPMRVAPLCINAQSYVADGKVGEPDHLMAWNYVHYGRVYWQEGYRDYNVTQGLFLQKATHDFDSIEFIMGKAITRVAAMMTAGKIFGGNKPKGLMCSECGEQETCLESPQVRRRKSTSSFTEDHPCVFGEDIGTPETGMNEDSSSALLQFENGAHGTYTQVFYSQNSKVSMRGGRISGYEGTIDWDFYRNSVNYYPSHKPFADTSSAGDILSHFGGDIALAEDFIGILKGTHTSRTTIEMGIQSAYTCLAARESARTGQFVDVRRVGQ